MSTLCRLFLFLSCVAVGACFVPEGAPEGRACNDAHPCPTGLECLADRCYAAVAPVALGPAATTYQAEQWSVVEGPYRAVNNVFGTLGLPAGWSQQVGIAPPNAEGRVAARLAWDFPKTLPEKEILAFPEVTCGLTAGFAPAAGAPLPRQLSSLTRLTTRYGPVGGEAKGEGQLAYDLWFTSSATSMASAQRRLEVMLPVLPVGGYGVPDSGPAAVGREGQGGTGRNPTGYVERTTLGGAVYDVFYWPPGANGLAWGFAVFEPLDFPGVAGGVTQWRPLLDYLLAKGFVTGADHLADVELGMQVVLGTGDLTIHGFAVEAE